MKYSVSLLSLSTYLLVIGGQVEMKEMKFAVSSMLENEQENYYQLKLRKPSAKEPTEEGLRFKERICGAILESDFFDSYNVELVNPLYPEIHDRVKEHDPDVYEKYYQRRDPQQSDELKFVNPYRLDFIFVRGTFVREWVFLCLTKNVETQNITQFFVSSRQKTANKRAVRFVFAYNKKREMVAIAKAERRTIVQHHHRQVQGPETKMARKHSEEDEETEEYKDDEEEYEDGEGKARCDDKKDQNADSDDRYGEDNEEEIMRLLNN